MLSQTTLTFLLRSHLPNGVRGLLSEGWNGVGILHPSADGETGELYLCVTFVSHTYSCPMCVSPSFQRELLTNNCQRSVLLMCVIARGGTFCKSHLSTVDRWWKTCRSAWQRVPAYSCNPLPTLDIKELRSAYTL